MSMILLLVEPDRIRGLTDTLVTFGKAPHAFAPKASTLSRTVLFTRGRYAVTCALRDAIRARGDVDLDALEPEFGRMALAECVQHDKREAARILLETERALARGDAQAPGSMCEAVLAGWSERHGRFRAIFTDAGRAIGNVTPLPDGFSMFPGTRPLDDPYRTLPTEEQLVLIANNLDLRERVEEGCIMFGGEMMLTTIDRDGVRTECIGRFRSYARDAAAIAQHSSQEVA